MKITTLLVLAFASHAALAQSQAAPIDNAAAPPGARSSAPLEPQAPADGPTGNIDGPPPTAPSDSPNSVTTPRLESSGSSGMQSEAGVPSSASGASTVPAHLEPQTKGDVTYVCGGVGKDESDAMKKQARKYDMSMTFAARDGSYLADVNVDIRDAQGNSVLQTTCDSPMLLVDVPRSGTYKVHASAAGYSLDRTAKVVKKQRKNSGNVASVVFVWPQKVAQGGTPETTSGDSGSGK